MLLTPGSALWKHRVKGRVDEVGYTTEKGGA